MKPSPAAAGVVVWFTGLPASGKSTLAREVRDRLAPGGAAAVVLDGDDVRRAVFPRHGYDARGRDEFYATLGHLAALLARQGLVVLVAATAHRAAYRDEARALAPAFVEVFVATTADECARRDPKGLYAGARAGTVRDLPGVDGAFEPPERPEAIARGGRDEDAAARIVALVQACLRRAHVETPNTA